MKAKEKESLRNQSAAELKTELRATREKRLKLEFKHRMGSTANPLELRTLRRRIAVLETFLKEGEKAKA